MKQFTWRYRAIDPQGRLHCGTTSAADVAALRQELDHRGLRLLRSGHRSRWLARLGLGRAARRDIPALITMTFHLAHLLEAGVPMTDALDELVLLDPVVGRRVVLADVRDRVRDGQTLSTALSCHPAQFDAHYRACVTAGEASGELPACLGKLEHSLRWQQALARRLGNLLTYPALAAGVLLITIGVLFGHVVPQLIGFLQSAGEAPRWQTESVVVLSGLVVDHGGHGALLVIVVLMSMLCLHRVSDRTRRWCSRCALHCGSLGRLRRDLLLARHADTTCLLLNSGVNLLESLTIAEAQVSNRWLRDDLARIRRRVVNGVGLADSMAASTVLPTTLVRLVAAGESSGALAPALGRAAQQLQLSAGHALERLETLLPSLVLGAVGLLLLWVVSAVIIPVYDLLTIGGSVL